MRKIFAALAVSALPVLAFASPAAATDIHRSDRDEQDVTRESTTDTTTCTLTISARIDYYESTDTSWVTVSNAVSGEDPDCGFSNDGFLDYSEFYVTWREENEAHPQNLFYSSGTSGNANISFTWSVDGRIESLTSEHEWRWTDGGGNPVVFPQGPLKPK